MSVVGEHAMLVFPVFWAAFAARSWGAFDGPTWVGVVAFTPLKIFWSGGAAVSIFFVLSGAVLSLPFHGGKTIGIGKYALKRMVRLYPVYFVGLLSAYILYQIVGDTNDPQTSAWFQRNWHVDIDTRDWARALLFMKSDFLQLNSPLWSIIHEARISILFPALMFAYRRNRFLTLSGSLAISACAIIFRLKFPNAGSDIANLSDTVSVVWLFMAGAWIAESRERIESAFEYVSAAPAFLLILVTILLLTAGFITPSPFYVSYFTTRGGAILAVVLAISGHKAFNFLESRKNDWLGYVSYSLYSCHFPIIYCVVKLADWTPLYVSVLAGCAIALIAALILCRTIEAWSLRASQAFRFDKTASSALQEADVASPLSIGS
ncbi:hypothetical protein BES08_11950 [Novosphingobium resinovorum]|uniref:Acyltransferase 3 domain-containing protein n=2 Tax=Novosphingobium resinovorum TaxID=158500 RepID=A0A1D8A5K8_9SPHN|nr:hypothetical protein BES08_11950 [Novosphingobium resinovorum]